MTANRRVFWMLASAFMALFCSAVEPIACAFFVLTTTIWISHNAMVLAADGRPE
jgi:hypothetical protein